MTRIDDRPVDMDSLMRESLRIGGQAYARSLELGRAMLGGYLDLWRGAAARAATCGVPETDCPPRCVCELSWEGQPRDTVRGTIRVANTGKDARTFAFVPTPLQTEGQPPGPTPAVEPATAQLAPGDSVLVTVAIPLSQGFETGRTYTGEIAVRGRYEQCVRVRVRVEAEPRPHCDVEQGEIPTRVRQHRWSDHFQCEEPCFEPVRPRPRDDGRE